VEQHAGSFRKLSTYVEDFIRVNELFIPPKINYETVFVSKYQTRLTEQHQQSTSAQQMASNQSQNVGQSTGLHTQRIVTTGGQSSSYMAGGYQQSLSGQRFGFTQTLLQGQ
jgi:hypothetical protein